MNAIELLSGIAFHDLPVNYIKFDSDAYALEIGFSIYDDDKDDYDDYFLSFTDVQNIEINAEIVILGDMEFVSLDCESEGPNNTVTIILRQGFGEQELVIKFTFDNVSKEKSGTSPQD